MGQHRSIVKQIFDNFWKSLKPKNRWGEIRGTDHHGTTYYEAPGDLNQRNTPSRWFVPKNPDNFDQDLPVEWQSWLWHRRKDPPSEEEIEFNRRQMLQTIANAKKFEKPETEKKITISDTNFPYYKDYETNPGANELKQK